MGKMQEMLQKAMSLDPNKKVEVRGVFLPVSEQVDNYTQYYWAEQFNAGVEKFKKIQEDPDNKKKYLNDAIKNFTDASKINPSDAQTYTTLSKCYLDLGDKENAINFIKTAVEKNPDNFDANFTAGQVMLRCDLSSEEVLPYYQKAVEIEPSNSSALRELASMYYDIDQKEKIHSSFSRCNSK